jgi:hypothetical protein
MNAADLEAMERAGGGFRAKATVELPRRWKTRCAGSLKTENDLRQS